MPRKTKDSENQDLEIKKSKSKTTSKVSIVKSLVKNVGIKKGDSKKKSADEENIKKTKPAKKESNSKSSTTRKTSSSTKNSITRKNTSTLKTTKNSSIKKDTSLPKNTNISKNKKVDIVEYYDLPYRYNQTIVKVLAQTPTNLFIYWDISDEDRENYKKQYGENFFETTKPVLKIYNDTMHYSFEVDINDFANSWYLHVNDSKCDYRVELGRRPINYNPQILLDYIYISASNEIEAPNDKILFNKMENMVYFRNVKNNSTRTKSVATLSFIRNMGKIYNIYDLYKEIYKNENTDEFFNPSSRFF